MELDLHDIPDADRLNTRCSKLEADATVSWSTHADAVLAFVNPGALISVITWDAVAHRGEAALAGAQDTPPRVTLRCFGHAVLWQPGAYRPDARSGDDANAVAIINADLAVVIATLTDVSTRVVHCAVVAVITRPGAGRVLTPIHYVAGIVCARILVVAIGVSLTPNALVENLAAELARRATDGRTRNALPERNTAAVRKGCATQLGPVAKQSVLAIRDIPAYARRASRADQAFIFRARIAVVAVSIHGTGLHHRWGSQKQSENHCEASTPTIETHHHHPRARLPFQPVR